ncbi:COMPASS-Shg1 multi-domain protein [Pyrenophora tritici-repentis]|nr:COMPASS-Shg1 multi-domain protein [Pyrenophora tritici-repentis]
MADVGRKRALDGDGPATVRKKLRPSELPLSQAKRAAIDGLVHMFQKKGTYDDIRRDLMKQYVSGPAKDELQAALKDLVERETDRNPSLLSKDPRMATTLIEGAGERSDIYGNIMNTVNTLLDRLIQEQGLPKMREYRIQEIGAEAAAEEEKRGSKTEEEWAQEAEARRERREAKREKELEEEREREREERAKKEERKRREREEDEAHEKARQEEKERRRKEREEREKEDEERRRKDRERIDKEREEERLRLKKEREEHEKSREARLKKIREEDAERERRIQEELDRDRGGRRRGGRGRSRTPEPLQLLLQESEQMKKSRQRPVLERSESLEPPMRKAQPPKSLVPRDPATTRLAKLESKSTSPAHGSPSKDSKTPAPKTPTALAKDDDTAMTDAPSIEKSRWDYPPELPSKLDKSRGRSRSRSVARTAASRATGLAVLRHLEKNGVAIVRARGHEGDGASANAAAAILALGVPTTLIAMYQVVALQPLVPPVNTRTVEIVSVRTVGRLGNVTTAVTVHEATVHETTTVGMAVENEEVDV